MDSIEIKNLRLRCGIGFSPHELAVAQDIVISLEIGCDSRRAGETDLPADAFNYKTVTKAIIACVEARRFSLVEKLAEEIARIALVDFGGAWAAVRVSKPGALRRADSVSIRIERQPEDFRQNVAFVSLGSNIAPECNLPAAVALLRRLSTVLAISPVYRSAPQGDHEQAHFLNMAVKMHSHRSPARFKAEVLDRIESELGRARDPGNINAPRTIDLDLSLWNDESFSFGRKPWTLPDAGILRYAHIAQPLADIAPEYALPGDGRSLRAIAAGFAGSGLQPVSIEFAE